MRDAVPYTAAWEGAWAGCIHQSPRYPELSRNTRLLAGEAMVLMHAESSGHHHLRAVPLCRLNVDSKALSLRSVAMNRNTALDVPLENTSLPLVFAHTLPRLRSCA